MKIHVKIQNRTYEVRIGDIHARPIQASVDGETFEVWPEEMTLPSEGYQPPAASSADKPVNPFLSRDQLLQPQTRSNR